VHTEFPLEPGSRLTSTLLSNVWRAVRTADGPAEAGPS